MGIKDRRNNEKAKMRKIIMDATIQIINEEGYDNLSIRKIANVIDYSPTTVYLYYKDKAQIIEEMTNELYHKVENDSIAAMDQYAHLSVEEQFKKVLMAFINSLISEPEMAKAIMYGGVNHIFSSGENKDLPDNKGLTTLEQMLHRGIQEGVFSHHSLGTSWMIISALFGFLLCAIENRLIIRDDFNDYSNQFVDLLIGGVKR